MIEVTRMIKADIVTIAKMKDESEMLPKEEAKKIIKQQMMDKLPVDAVLDIEIKDFIADVEGD